MKQLEEKIGSLEQEKDTLSAALEDARNNQASNKYATFQFVFFLLSFIVLMHNSYSLSNLTSESEFLRFCGYIIHITINTVR